MKYPQISNQDAQTYHEEVLRKLNLKITMYLYTISSIEPFFWIQVRKTFIDSDTYWRVVKTKHKNRFGIFPERSIPT